jgi:putative tricarboxylic transport membrane protein
MDALVDLLNGFATALTPANLAWAALGVILGTAVGVLPGIGTAMTVALLLPVTFGLDPTAAFIMFAGIFYGGMFGGSTTSILLNTPGESSSVITAIEGNLMARRGRAAQALATAAIGSFVAGLIGTALLVLLAPAIVDLAVGISAADYFAIMVLAFTGVTAVLGASRIRGLASLAIGLTIGLIGIDLQTGQQRLTFGIPQLADGIDVIVVAVGIFAIGEALWVAAHLSRRPAEIIPTGRAFMSREDWRRSWKPWLRGTAIGFPFGALPAGGAEIPTFLSYVTEKRLSKHSEEFGKGAIEGVAGPEATNNASAAGTLVPMLTLGLPTNATAAVMLAAFIQYGIQPGPLLFEREGELVWALIASLFIGNTLLLLLNLPLAPIWARLLRIPRPYLYAGILFFAAVGAYSVNASTVDLVILLVIGLIGFIMRRYGLPVVPAIIGVILGPRAELQLRRTFQLSGGEISGLWHTPLAKLVYLIIAIILLWPLVSRFLLRGRHPLAEVAGVPPEGREGGERRAPGQPAGGGAPRSRVPEAEPPEADGGRDERSRP